jgi:hypothetical protein
MKIQIQDDDGRPIEKYVTIAPHPLLDDSVMVLVADDRIYGSADWLSKGGKIIHATPYERARFPGWLFWSMTGNPGGKSAAQREITTKKRLVFDSKDYSVSKRTERGILVVESRGISTLQNAAANTAVTMSCGNIITDRLGMVVDLTGLKNWQDPEIHRRHMTGYPRTNTYTERHAFVCEEGFDRDIYQENVAVSGPLGYQPAYFTRMKDAIDYIHSLPPLFAFLTSASLGWDVVDALWDLSAGVGAAHTLIPWM